MAEGKKTFIFYSDWINMVREMPDKDAGELLKHILSYVNDEDPTTKNILVKMAFGHMKPVLKSDLERWESIRNKRKVSGAKGGKASAKQKQANANQVQAVNDNVNVYTTYITKIKDEKIFLEGVYMRHGFRKGTMNLILKDFIAHLKMFPVEHDNYLKFRNHFGSWINFNANTSLEKYKRQQKGML